ncbi:MAG TPA: hypothetical protein VHC95_03725 [Opitutales bacterium]|nr:hypothetical protein [Opitutales bacterium]
MKLDRLLNRIRAALQGYATEFEQRALAEEYADWCAKAGERLEQIVPLIRQGQDFPALQIAESPPPVLDLVRQLAFAEAEQWRAFCLKQGLPAARPFDERSVELVNQLYGKKISETHPLYREYRQAVRTRRDDEALRVLRSIRRVNPDDANAHAEFARLAHKLFEQRRAALADALERNDATRALALMESIETDSLPGRETDAGWQQAQKFREDYLLNSARRRCLELVALLRQARDAGQWRETLPLLAEWDVLHGQFAIVLPEEAEADAAAAREWATGLLAQQETGEEQKKFWRDLEAYAGQLAREDPGKKTARTLSKEIAEVTANLAVLVAESSGEAGEQPPEELRKRLRHEAARLRAQLRKRQLQMAGFAAAAVAAMLALAFIAFWFESRANLHQTVLTAIRQHFQDGATKELADSLKQYDAHFRGPEGDPALDTLLTQARDFVNSHQSVVERFDKELAQITDAAANPSPSQTRQLLANLDKLDQETTGLGADDAQRGKAAVQNLRVRLQQHLAQAQDSRTAKLTDIAQRVTAILAEKLAAPMTAEAAQPIIAEAQKILAEADALPPDPAAASTGEAQARARLAELAQKAEALSAAASAAQTERAQLPQARTLEDYQNAAAALAGNALDNETTAAAARALFAKNPNWADAAQRILLPDDPDTWAFLKQVGEARLLPAESNQGDDVSFWRLVSNNLLANTYRADLVTYADGEETSREPVALAGQPSEKTSKLDTVEELVQSANRINADGSVTALSVRWVQFTGKKPNGKKLENVKLTPESDLLARVRAAYSRDRSTIAQPLLRVLDDVRSSQGVSPLFKAYLEQEIFRIMQNRPRDWGLAFSPKAQAAAQQLAKITGGHLQPSDWLFPSPDSRLNAAVQAFFTSDNGDSYFDDAMTNLLALLKKRATPLRFAGYVDLNGAAHSSAPDSATVWGLDAAGRWAPLYHGTANGQPAPISGGASPARLTPLVFPQDNGSGGP